MVSCLVAAAFPRSLFRFAQCGGFFVISFCVSLIVEQSCGGNGGLMSVSLCLFRSGDNAVDAITRVRWETNVRHGAVFGDVDE